MKRPNIRIYSLKKINEDIEKLKQLHDLSTIETIIVTISISALVLGITIWQNAKGDIRWLAAGGILIITAVYPAWFVIESFFSKDDFRKIINLEIIILISGLQLIVVFLGFGIIYLTTIPIIRDVLHMLSVNHPDPFLFFIIFKGLGLFMYYWLFNIVPDFEERRFSLLFKKRESRFEFINETKGKFNVLLRKYYYILILAYYMVFIVWGLLINEYFQVVVIIFIGFITSCFIYFYKRSIKKILLNG